MAGFLKRMFRFGKQEAASEARHAPEEIEGTTSDVEVSVTDAPDADLHRQAKATVVADEEAGADLQDDSTSIEKVADTPPPPSRIDEEAQAERAKREAAERKKKLT